MTEPRILDLTRELVTLRQRRRDVDMAILDAEDSLVEVMAEHSMWELEVDGIGVVKRRSGSKRTQWKHDDLWRAMGRLAQESRSVDPDTGEVESVADAYARLVVAACAPNYWRVGALTAAGLDVDEYCEKVVGRPTIQVVS